MEYESRAWNAINCPYRLRACMRRFMGSGLEVVSDIPVQVACTYRQICVRALLHVKASVSVLREIMSENTLDISTHHSSSGRLSVADRSTETRSISVDERYM